MINRISYVDLYFIFTIQQSKCVLADLNASRHVQHSARLTHRLAGQIWVHIAGMFFSHHTSLNWDLTYNLAGSYEYEIPAEITTKTLCQIKVVQIYIALWLVTCRLYNIGSTNKHLCKKKKNPRQYTLISPSSKGWGTKIVPYAGKTDENDAEVMWLHD